MKGLIIAVVVVLVAALLAGSMYFSRRNEIVSLQEAIRASWAQVDVAIERRADLIPNLVATVKGFAAHEQKAIEDVANARASGGITALRRLRDLRLRASPALPRSRRLATAGFRGPLPGSTRAQSLGRGPVSHLPWVSDPVAWLTGRRPCRRGLLFSPLLWASASLPRRQEHTGPL